MNSLDSKELINLTLQKAGSLLKNREISSVELTRAFLERIHSVDDKIKAFVTVTDDVAIRQAKAADARIASDDIKPLTGIPMQLKDNMITSGIRTTCSSKMLSDFVPTYDSTVAKRLYEHGAILLGKGNLDEFAMGSSTEHSAFFPTRNPWDINRVPGGRSGGPTAAVAANEWMFALGSDTGGSIRQPASFCGIVGLKPTYGLVSRYGLIAFASSLDQIGPITKDVTDNAIVLNAIAGHDPNDSTSIPYEVPDYTEALGKDLYGIHIGVPKEYFIQGIDTGVADVIHESIAILESLGATIEETSLAHTDNALAVYYIIAPSEASANLARYDGVKYGFSSDHPGNMWETLEHTRKDGFGAEVKRRMLLGTYALSAGYYDAYYLKAQKVRTLIRRDFEKAFKRFDALVMPTSPSVAFKLGEKMENPIQMYLNDILTLPANIAGIPGISIPAGLSDGLPVGLQIMGKPLGEETVIRIAHAYEQSIRFRSSHQPSPI